MTRLTRDGTAEPVPRDQILRHVWGQVNIYFPYSADHGQDWQPYPLDPYTLLYVMTIHTIIVYNYLSIFYYVLQWFCFVFVWCPCMAINVSVQDNGGFLPGIILLTQRYYHRVTRLNATKRFCIRSL